MRIKKFHNIWTMSLILLIALLVSLYAAKIFFPTFIVGVAETPLIVAIGTYIDTHKWAYYLYYTITSFISLYLYVCAVCRIRKLKLFECGIIVVSILIYFLLEAFLPNITFTYNTALYFILTYIVCRLRKIKDYRTFYSSCVCLLITALGQSLSLEIRGISTLITYPNTATFFILLIDLYIWSGLLYLFYNYKGENKNG